MTLTVKDFPEIAGRAKPGSPMESPATPSARPTRSKPVCLEVPVTLRSLPEGSENAPRSSGPARQEGRTIIVFENAAVIRTANSIPPGQRMILSNPQGRDVVCRVEKSENLSNIKGYVEVQFIEAVDDFWGLRQTRDPGRSPNDISPKDIPNDLSPSKPSATVLPQPVKAAPSPAPPVTFCAETSELEAGSASSNAPSFDDIAGLVQMSLPTQMRGKQDVQKNVESPVVSNAGKGCEVSALGQPETAKTSSSIKNEKPSVSKQISQAPATPMRPEAPLSLSRQPVLSNNFMSGGLLSSAQGSSASSRSASRWRMPLIAGGAILVLVGFGAGYFLLHQAGTAGSTQPVALTSQPATSAVAEASSVPDLPAVSEPAVDPAPAVSTGDSGSVAKQSPALSDLPKQQRLASPAESMPPDRAPARRRPVLNLKMSSPMVPSKVFAQPPAGSSQGAPDVAMVAAAGATPAGAMLSSVVRTGNQPVAPPGIPRASSEKTVREAKLVSSIPPVYPVMAKQSNVQGNVVVAASVDARGSVVDAKIVSGPMSLRQAALDAVRKWKYSPALIDGQPAASRVTVTLDFRLN